MIIAFIILAIIHAPWVKGTEVSIALSDEVITFEGSIVINVSVAIGNETAEKPALEIHLPPKLRFVKGGVDSVACASATECRNESMVLKLDEGEVMGKFSLGDRVIKATRSLVISRGRSGVWPPGFVYHGTIRLENVTMSNVDENPQFAICVFKYWRATGSKDQIAAVESQILSGKYFRLDPVKLTVQAASDQGFDGVNYRLSAQNSISINLTANIHPGAGNVILKVTVPSNLLLDKSWLELGHNNTDTSVMQIKNQTTNTIDLYVLITPSMMAGVEDKTAVLEVWLKARDNQLSTGRVFGSVLYGYNFQSHVDAPPVNVVIVAPISSDIGPRLTPSRTVIEYAPAPRLGGQLFDEGNKTVASNTLFEEDSTDSADGTVSGATSGTESDPMTTSTDPWTPLTTDNLSAVPGDMVSMQPSTDMLRTETAGPTLMLDDNTTVQNVTSATDSMGEEETTPVTDQSTSPVLNSTTKVMESVAIEAGTLWPESTDHTDPTDGEESTQSNTESTMENTSVSTVNSTQSTRGCKSGWWTMDVMFSDCYYFPSQSLSYLEAENVCIGLGGHLPSFLTIYDFLALSTFWKNKLSSTEVWIGFQRNTSQDAWKWTDGSQIGYIDWCEGYYTDIPKNCAVCSSAVADNYCWKNRYCDQSMYFFCTRPRVA